MTPPSPTNDTVSIVINGMTDSGYEAVDITRGVLQMPSSFVIKTTDKYASLNQVLFKPMDTFQLKIGSDVVITGYMDTIVSTISKGHEFNFSGRGKCSRIADASAFIKDSSGATINNTVIMNSTILDVAKSILPSDISLVEGNITTKLYTIPYYICNLGDTIWEVLDELSRYNALLLYENSDGNLVLSQIGTATHSSGLTVDNCEEYTSVFDYSGRYSDYFAYYFSLNPNQDMSANSNVNLVGHYQDSDVPIFKPLAIISPQVAYNPADGTVTQSVAALMAQWECAIRRGRSETLRVKVTSWGDSSGLLWQPNYLINVDLPQAHISNQTMVISKVTYHKGEDGTYALLEIMPAAAFTPQPNPITSEMIDILNSAASAKPSSASTNTTATQ